MTVRFNRKNIHTEQEESQTMLNVLLIHTIPGDPGNYGDQAGQVISVRQSK